MSTENIVIKRTNKAAMVAIIFCEFCERFSYYGMRALLPSYLKTKFYFTNKETSITIHLFTFCNFLFPFFGGIISDNYFGKFKTIIFFLVIFFFGLLCLLITSTYLYPKTVLLFHGLFFIAAGCGGIKPCVSPFGGDQIESENTKTLSLFFNVFYFTINVGSLLSTAIIPSLVDKNHCFGQSNCYALGFFLISLLTFFSIVLFLSFSSFYIKKKPSGKICYEVFSVFWCALKKKKTEKGKSFFSYAIPEHSSYIVNETENLFSILSVLSPLLFFWALYEQQASSWYLQGTKMEEKIYLKENNFSIRPEQMQMFNPTLILILVPLMIFFVYPFFQRKRKRFFQLKIIFIGMIMSLLSFLCTIILEIGILQQKRNKMAKLSILFQLPQYFFITLGEVFVSSPGIDFAYTNSPIEMKSLCQAGWFFFIALGNLFVVFIKSIGFERMVQSLYRELFLFVFYFIIMLFAIVIFSFNIKK